MITDIIPPSLGFDIPEDNPKAVIDEIWQIVNNEFVDLEFNRINWKEKRQELLSQKYKNSKQAYKIISEALKKLGDPYTRFLPPQEFSMLTSQTSGELSGIGIRLARFDNAGRLSTRPSIEKPSHRDRSDL